MTFDVDNDGESPDDIVKTVDIKSMAPFLHNKNTHLFFGTGNKVKAYRIVRGNKSTE